MSALAKEIRSLVREMETELDQRHRVLCDDEAADLITARQMIEHLLAEHQAADRVRRSAA